MKKVILIVLDGWGIAPPQPGNAPSQANIPAIKNIEEYYPATILHASGINVGLPWWEEGNSEVGHLTMGCGQIIYQYLPRIITAIQNGSFFENPALIETINYVKKKNSRLHLMGLVSSGAIHSYIDHLYALLDLCKKNNIEKVFLHVFTDGRDTPQKEAVIFLQNLNQRLQQGKLGEIATVCGRSFAMDRDENWDRIKKVYQCLTEGEGKHISNLTQYLENSYQMGLTDEYIEPAVLNPEGIIKKNDGVIFFNFREDRAKELTRAFVEENFKGFERKIRFNIGGEKPDLCFATMTKYLENNPYIKVAFEPPKIENTLGKVISDAGFFQLRIAETEKYAHVTYFFNGLKEKPFPGEDRVIIPSVGGPHYDKNPEMRALTITEKVIEEIKKEKYQFILVNFANADMVGHTGNLKAAIKAAEILDGCVKKITEESKNKYVTMITADHGNFEEMINQKTGEIIGEHSSNPVPFYLVDLNLRSEFPQKKELEFQGEAGGFLFDIAPTILEYLEIKKPNEMTGISLLSTLLR